MLAELNERIEKLKSTSWMLNDATHTDEEDVADSDPVQGVANCYMETLTGSDVTVADFVNYVAESGVLSQPDLTRLERDYLPGHRDRLAEGLA